MVKITVKADCGNSPKKLFLKEFHSALAKGEMVLVEASVADDITWERIGEKELEGKAAVVKALKHIADQDTAELLIKTIVTHGKEAAVNGERILANGKKAAFCDVYEFRSAAGNTINVITSYVIDVK